MLRSIGFVGARIQGEDGPESMYAPPKWRCARSRRFPPRENAAASVETDGAPVADDSRLFHGGSRAPVSAGRRPWTVANRHETHANRSRSYAKRSRRAADRLRTDPHGCDRARTGSRRGRTVGDGAVPISNAPDRGAAAVERAGAALGELRAEVDPARRESYRLDAEFYVCRTRVDGSETLPSGRRTRSPGSGRVRIGSRCSRPRIVCLRLGTGGVAILADAAKPTQFVIISSLRGARL